MCGIFGAIGKSIKNDILQIIAEEALKRGPQAYGIAFYEDENFCIHKYANAIKPKKAFQGIKPSAIIGNCRLSTSGSFNDIVNNQPIEENGTSISHNGNIRSYLQVAKEYNISLKTKCDSEIICHLVNALGVKKTLEVIADEAPMALLILQNKKLTAYRKGQPLFHLESDGCHYFCSRPFLGAVELAEGKIYEFGGNE